MSSTTKKLSTYFTELSIKGKEMPYMTVIAKEANVSPASITRYAKSRGHYSFSSMRADYNKSLEESLVFDVKRIGNFAKKFKDSKIVFGASLSTEFMLPFIVKNLRLAGFDASFICDYSCLDEELHKKECDAFFFITMTGESNRFIKFITTVPKTKGYIITTNAKLQKKYRNVIRAKIVKDQTDNFISKNATIIDLLSYINRIITYLYALNLKENCE